LREEGRRKRSSFPREGVLGTPAVLRSEEGEKAPTLTAHLSPEEGGKKRQKGEEISSRPRGGGIPGATLSVSVDPKDGEKPQRKKGGKRIGGFSISGLSSQDERAPRMTLR